MEKNYNTKEYWENIYQSQQLVFEDCTRWSEADFEEYSKLLEELKSSADNSRTTREKGDKLENIVAFIIKKSFFFEVYSNVTTATNEIDEVITLSKKGKCVLESGGTSRSLLEIDSDIFIGECKNYNQTLNVTFVGKFYSLMMANDLNFGIIFTVKGLTGKEDEYHDAYGLIKVLRIIEKYKNDREFTILTFTIEDFEKIKEGMSFYEIIRAKKIANKLGTTYEHFLSYHHHDNEDAIGGIITKINS